MTHDDLKTHIAMLQNVRSNVLMMADDCLESIVALEKLLTVDIDDEYVAGILGETLEKSKERFRQLAAAF